MKIRQGFVSNSSSSSFVIALPKDYKISDEDIEKIRNEIENYDCYFAYYEEIAETEGNTELLDEREKIQKMLESGNFKEPEEEEPVNDDIKNKDIVNGFEFLTTNGFLETDSYEYDFNSTPTPTLVAAVSIVEVLEDSILIDSLETASGGGCIINILADNYSNTEGMKLVKDSIKNEN